MYTQNEIMFPRKAIAVLRNMRGPEWKALVDRVQCLPATHEESLAFMLMMIRLNGCIECETDSYRAMRGCQACAIQTLRRFKGADSDLLDMYQKALVAIQEYLEQQLAPAEILTVLEVA
ncbi:MAG: hypothetical protein GYB66_00655 [Chloroflexi bacterium]|nr:hypothetical protein [Chloroflexota bacterium]